MVGNLDQCAPASHLVIRHNADCSVGWSCVVADPRTAVAIEHQVLLSLLHYWLLHSDNDAWHIYPLYGGLERHERP